MTSKEEKTIEKLIQLVSEVKEENRLLTQKLNETVEQINNKVEQKHIPISLE